MKTLLDDRSEHAFMRRAFLVLMIGMLVVLAADVAWRIKIERDRAHNVWAIDPRSGVSFRLSHIERDERIRKAAYKCAVRTLYKNLFQFDQYTFYENLETASYFIDSKSLKREVDKYVQVGLIDRLRESNMTLSVQIEKIEITFGESGVRGVCRAIQTQATPNGRASRRLDSSFRILDLERVNERNATRSMLTNFIITDDTGIEKK